MFSKTLTHAGHTRSFVVSALPALGWEVRVEHDREIVRRSRYTDWHRVERAVSAIEREVGLLQATGWLAATEDSGRAAHSTNL